MSLVIDKVVNISEFKKNPSKYLNEVREGTPLTITQGSRAAAIVISREELARLLIRLQELEDELETRELLSDPEFVRRFQKLPERGTPLHEARAILRAKNRSR